jgi:hypothetical protein
VNVPVNTWNATRDFGSGLSAPDYNLLWSSWTGSLTYATDSTLAAELKNKVQSGYPNGYAASNIQWFGWDAGSGKSYACRARQDFINAGSGSFSESGGVYRGTASVSGVVGIYSGGEPGSADAWCAADASSANFSYELSPGFNTLCRINGTSSSSCDATTRGTSSATASQLATAFPGSGVRGRYIWNPGITHTMETKYDPLTSGAWAQFNNLAANSTVTIQWDDGQQCVAYLTLSGSTTAGNAFGFAGEVRGTGAYDATCAKFNGIWSYVASGPNLVLTLEKKSAESTLSDGTTVTFAP